MPKLIGRIGAHQETYVLSDPRLERKGFLSIYSFAVDGMPHRMEMMDRGRAVIILPVDWTRRVAVLIEQPRFLLAGDSVKTALGLGASSVEVPADKVLTVECPAGMIDGDETPEEAAVRELREETGADVPVSALTLVQPAMHPSIGGTTERFHLYFADLSAVRWVEPRGDGSEQIAVWEMAFDELFGMLDRKEIASASAGNLIRELRIEELKREIASLKNR